MSEQTFNVELQGYWRDKNKSGISNHSGVYFVYVATYNQQKETVLLNKLIYIGESDNVNVRVQNHEKYEEWKTYLSKGQELYFSTGQVDDNDRFRVEAAYIFKHKPHVNTEYVNSFPFDQTTINSSGTTALLDTSFKVFRT